MKAKDILLAEGLSEQDIEELKNEIEEVNNEYGDASKATYNDVLKEYFKQKANRVQRRRQEVPRKVEETKEYMERYKMGAEDVRSTAEEERQRAMKRKPKTPEPSPHNSDSEGEEAETLRLKAMKPHKIVEDKSDIYGEVKGKSKLEGVEKATGAGLHTMYGETHTKAKLTNAQANEIRNLYWTKKETNQLNLAEKFKINPSVIHRILMRKTWSHLPQAEGEPDETYKAPNNTDLKVMKKAKELGVEPVTNKIGRLRLPDEVLKAVRAKAAVKRAATVKKKKEAKE